MACGLLVPSAPNPQPLTRYQSYARALAYTRTRHSHARVCVALERFRFGAVAWQVPYADFNLLKFPDKARAMEKIADLTLLSDIFPTGFHGAVQANVRRPPPLRSLPARAHC